MKYIAASMAAASAIQVKSKNLSEALAEDEIVSGTINVDGMDIDWALDVDYGFEYDNDWDSDYSSESVSNNFF